MSLYVTAIDAKGTITDSSSDTITTEGINGAEFMHIANDFLLKEGVVEKNNDSFLVEESGTPSENVTVNPGVAYVENDAFSFGSRSLTKYWRVVSDGSEVVTIDATSANPRIDLLCLKVDDTITPNAEATNVASLVAVKGTEASSPTVPSLPDDHILLAEIDVPFPMANITNSDITDRRSEVIHMMSQPFVIAE